jgi:hypothetical protein
LEESGDGREERGRGEEDKAGERLTGGAAAGRVEFVRERTFVCPLGNSVGRADGCPNSVATQTYELGQFDSNSVSEAKFCASKHRGI